MRHTAKAQRVFWGVLLSSALALLAGATPARAQYTPPPEGFRVCETGGCAVVYTPNTWYTKHSSGSLSWPIYVRMATTGHSGCIQLQVEYEYAGYTTANNWRGPMGFRSNVVHNTSAATVHGYYAFENLVDDYRNITLRSPSTVELSSMGYLDDYEWPYYVHPLGSVENNFQIAGNGYTVFCIENGAGATSSAYIQFSLINPSYWTVTQATARMRWNDAFAGFPTPTPIPSPTPIPFPTAIPTLTPTPRPTPTPRLDVTVMPWTFDWTPGASGIKAPEVNIAPYNVDTFLNNWWLWGVSDLLLEGVGVANFRDYIAVVFATVGIARFLAKPPQVPHRPATRVVIEKK